MKVYLLFFYLGTKREGFKMSKEAKYRFVLTFEYKSPLFLSAHQAAKEAFEMRTCFIKDFEDLGLLLEPVNLKLVEESV